MRFSPIGTKTSKPKETGPRDKLPRSFLFRSSGLMFRLGLALDIFEEIRPLDVLLADYFFFVALLLLVSSKERSLLVSRGSGVLLSSGLLLTGVLVSGLTTPSAVRLVILFGAFAPLAIAHSEDLWRNLRYVVGGTTLNCAIAIVAATFWPGIVDTLSVHSRVPDFGEEVGRFGGLSGHPNSLGISAALAVVIAVGLALRGNNERPRYGIYLQMLVCVIGAVLSGSRTFFVALVPPLIVLTLWRRLSARKVGAVFLILIGFAAFLWVVASRFFPSSSEDYMSRLGQTDEEYGANEGRLLTAGVALAQISQRPISGWGLEHFGEAGMMFLPADDEYLPAHVVLLHYWYAEGILGAIGFMSLFLLPCFGMIRAGGNDRPEGVKSALRLGVCVYLSLFISSNLHPVLLNRFLFMPLFMFGGILAVIRRSSQKKTLPPAWVAERRGNPTPNAYKNGAIGTS